MQLIKYWVIHKIVYYLSKIGVKACEFGGCLPVLVHCQPQYVDGTQGFVVMYGDLRKVMVQGGNCTKKNFKQSIIQGNKIHAHTQTNTLIHTNYNYNSTIISITCIIMWSYDKIINYDKIKSSRNPIQ